MLKHGRAWERYAYVKARLIFPDKQTNERNTIINSIIKPFVFRKYLDYGILESLRELKSMIAKEVLRKNLFDDIKLGPGGIREIEIAKGDGKIEFLEKEKPIADNLRQHLKG